MEFGKSSGPSTRPRTLTIFGASSQATTHSAPPPTLLPKSWGNQRKEEPDVSYAAVTAKRDGPPPNRPTTPPRTIPRGIARSSPPTVNPFSEEREAYPKGAPRGDARLPISTMYTGNGISQDTTKMQLPHDGNGFSDKLHQLPEAPRSDSSPIRSGNQKNYGSHGNYAAHQASAGIASPVYSHDVMPTSTAKSPSFHALKRSRSPPVPPSGASATVSHLLEADSERSDSSPIRSGNQKKFYGSRANYVARQTSASVASPAYLHDIISTSTTNSPDFHALKRSRSPPVFPSGVFATVSHLLEADSEREMHAKAKRLARFGAELSQPVQNVYDHNRNISSEAKLRHNVLDKNMAVDYSSQATAVSQDRGIVHDQEDSEPSAAIIGLCQDMCPESEREERERKGDLDQYERLDGDRNQTHISLAVKKYNRTAERSALLIRPMPVLRKTMDYLLHLLDQPYDDKFLGIYNFLWDRMRAVRMDLRMQHIFNKDAIIMLEQMIRLHIISMHELCEYAKGEGFSEGFDAHLNIEQMNKASVELFQMYDDHRKKGLHVMTENEFRGYYALLKLDRHPGYKVEPAELSLDLAKMTPDIRHSPEILFARAVARACRTGNFIAFFRLSGKATYLQACLMHVHFAKLRRNALASLHSSLQNNQGIPVVQVIQWLGMEGEDIESLLKYHGFAIKTFEEAYMVKDGPFLNSDVDYTTKCSELVHSKKSRNIIDDVSANQISVTRGSMGTTEASLHSFKRNKPSPRITESPIVSDVRDTFGSSHNIVESPATTLGARKTFANEEIKTPSIEVQFAAADVEMPDFADVLSPKDDRRLQLYLTETSTSMLHSNSEYTFEDEHLDEGLPVSRADSPLHYDLTDNEVVERDMGHTSQEPPIKTEDRVMQIQMATASMPDIIMGSPSYQKEMHDQGRVEEALLQVAREKSEAARQRIRMIIRTWKRLASRKREIREQRQELANIALNSISVGLPIRHTETVLKQSCDTREKFNLDVILKERNERYRQSWSQLNIADLVGPTLNKRNPMAKCVCWKLAVCIHKSDMEENRYSLMSTWLLSKLMGSRRSDGGELVVDSPDLCMWKSLVDGCDGCSPSLCLSVIREVLLGEHNGGTLDGAMIGTNAIIYVVSESVPWEIQSGHLNMLLASIPPQSRLPLLILFGSACNEDAHQVSIRLGLQDIDESKISRISVISLTVAFLEAHLSGFFSDENLREGLEWLAEQTLPQPNLHLVKTRELVLSYLSPLIETLYHLGPSKVDPNLCIAILNEALDQSAKQIQDAADMNPNHWPCPEIGLLSGSSTGWQVKGVYLPSTGWSSAAEIKPVVDALRRCKLPHFSYELSFLNQGSHMGKDLPLQKTRLEECLVGYLTQSAEMISGDLARKEAHLMLQKGAALELNGVCYYLIPRWVTIFQRIYNWRLMKLTDMEFAWAYVLESEMLDEPGEVNRFDRFQFGDNRRLAEPPLDEMMGVGCSFLPDQAAPLVTSETSSDTSGAQVDAAVDSGTSDDEDLRFGGPPEAEAVVSSLQQNQATATTPMNAGVGFGKLRMLLEECKVLQDRIDQKLAVYF